MSRPLHVKSRSIALTSNTTNLVSATNANRVSHFWTSQNTPFGSQGTELYKRNTYIWGFYLKAVYNSCKSQRILQVAKFLFMYSFTHTNIVFLFKHQPTKIVLPDKVFQWWYFFLFLRESFANIPPTFLISCEIKDSKIFWTVHLKPFIRYQGKNLNLFWICYFQFFFHYLVQPNQAIHFLFHIICIIRIRLWIF